MTTLYHPTFTSTTTADNLKPGLFQSLNSLTMSLSRTMNNLMERLTAMEALTDVGHGTQCRCGYCSDIRAFDAPLDPRVFGGSEN